MFCFFVVVVLLLVFSRGDNPAPTAVLTVAQPVDWTQVLRNTTFMQRVLVYDKYYVSSHIPKDQRPIFFCAGGEADVHSGYNHNGFMFEFGQSLGALLVFPEHRYYGQSLPFGSNSWTKQNIYYLTVSQALHDYVNNLDLIRKAYNVPQEAPVVAFGGSYPGELAALLRVRYPDRFDMALASSAPLARNPPSSGFFRVTTESFAIADAQCPNIVRSAFDAIDDLFSTQSYLDLQLRLSLCAQQTIPRLIYLWVLNAFATLAMENYPYAAGDLVAYPMFQACKNAVETMNVAGDPIAALGTAIGVIYNNTGTNSCFDINANDFLNCADITGCGSGNDALSWDYQSCTDLEFQIDTNNVTDMFPPVLFNQKTYNSRCEQRWNISPGQSIAQRLNLTFASNIIFSNGLLDGWEPLGILKSPNPGSIITVQYVGAHHEDLRGTNVNDTRSVTHIRDLEKRILSQWISDAHLNRTRLYRK